MDAHHWGVARPGGLALLNSDTLDPPGFESRLRLVTGFALVHW
jgi:hypothetical protein